MTLLFKSGLGFLLSGINQEYKRYTSTVFSGKEASFNFNDLGPDFSKTGLKNYFIG